MTDGPTAMTRKYAAPEVLEGGPKNSASDIFSLGCVYFELLMTLRGIHNAHEQQPYGTDSTYLAAQLRSRSIAPCYVFLRNIIVRMTQLSPKERSTARLVSTRPGFSCLQCVTLHRSTTRRFLTDVIGDKTLEDI